MADSLVVGSKVKAFIKEKGCHTSSDAVEALSNHVAGVLERAVERCKSNKRSTIKPQDL